MFVSVLQCCHVCKLQSTHICRVMPVGIIVIYHHVTHKYLLRSSKVNINFKLSLVAMLFQTVHKTGVRNLHIHSSNIRVLS